MKKVMCLAVFMMLFVPFFAINAQDEAKKWDVANPEGPSKTINFTTDEGTWMNLDVSPDGKTIVFDMMGDIYTVPVSGGMAKALRTGLPFEVQPRFSPDGTQISFTSDAGGGDNIWVMNADGTDAQQVTDEEFRLLNNAAWTPDGEYLIARKHFTSQRSLGAGEIWMYHKTGGSGIQLVEKMNDQQDINEPEVSPDGRYVYYSQDVYPGGYFQYNKDPNSVIYAIKRYDRDTGETKTIIRSPGGAARPELSADGSKMAYIKRVRTKTVLYVYDFDSGISVPVFDRLSKDQQEAWAIFGVYPNFDWMPNNRDIVIWGEGTFWKVNTESFEYNEIAFEVDAEHEIYDAVSFRQDVAPEKFTVKAIRQAVTSPDEKWLIFNAAGYLYKKKLPDGTPVRLTNQLDHLEFEPIFSPDGKKLAYTVWSDEEMGAIYEINWKANSPRGKKISMEKGIYREPSYSPDGNHLLFRKESGNYHQGFAYTQKPGIYRMNLQTAEVTMFSDEGSNARFSADSKRIFYLTGGEIFGSLDKGYHSVDLDGNDKRTHFTSTYATSFTPSPDNKWVAFNHLYKVYVAPMPKVGQPITLNKDTKAVPVAQVAKDAGVSLHWSADGEKLHWTMGEQYFTAKIEDHFSFLSGDAEAAEPEESGNSINLKLKSDKPSGMLALTGARIITMNADREVIENGTILIKDNKIEAVGSADQVDIPSDAKELNVEGKTIIPGLVDVHAHLGNFRYGLSPQQQWEYHANLAYGVTTAHDPSANSEMIFSQAEMIKTGNMVGPRVYSTGVILYGADGDFKAVINDYDDAYSALKRTKAWGAMSVKSYNQPRREQRQMVIKAARELEMMVYPEGGSFFFHNMSMILDGHTGVEHNIPVAPGFKDVQEVWSNSNTGYTPTLIVNYGGMNGEYYFYQKWNVWENERLLTFTPRNIVDPRSRHRTKVPDEEYDNGHILVSQTATKLMRKGVNLNLGAHGQLQGLGAHWELWMLHQGGLTEMEALQTATINGANYLGMGDQIGSLEKGKLADLVILNANPLDDIYNTDSVTHTMINGRLFDASTMDETGLQMKQRMPFWWEREQGGNPAFDWHSIGATYDNAIQCSCQRTHSHN